MTIVPRLLQKVRTVGGPTAFLHDCQRAVDKLAAEQGVEHQEVTSMVKFWVRQGTNAQLALYLQAAVRAVRNTRPPHKVEPSLVPNITWIS